MQEDSRLIRLEKQIDHLMEQLCKIKEIMDSYVSRMEKLEKPEVSVESSIAKAARIVVMYPYDFDRAFAEAEKVAQADRKAYLA